MDESTQSRPTLTVFAGPNGSGKTTLTKLFYADPLPGMGILVNADVIAANMAKALGLAKADKDLEMQAAHDAEATRFALMQQRQSFSTETVMSDRNRWLRFFQLARDRGYLVQLVFISTRHPSINVARVLQRVKAGGHPVPPEKIVDRYSKTHALLPEILGMVDAAWLFDNSDPTGNPQLVLVMGDDHVLLPESGAEMPPWALELL
ncbi:zeta toxin family protein [Diaphorobacter sp. J5-51]|uniref:zeta toxin family protein n=1 Tax=Diaphorobacter sp. J5-51 TaxID=680496 RepID=UPI0018FEB307|nr:zeta toxin family protein [Diaphorobacter sp. J5-51]